MKSFNLFKNNTSWLSYLKSTMFVMCVLFIFSLIIFFIDAFYTADISKAIAVNNSEQIGTTIWQFDSITYVVCLALVVLETVGIVYCLFNLASWWKSYSKSKDKRKEFNLKFCIAQTVMLILILLDCLFRLVFVFSNFNKWQSNNDSTNNVAISSINFAENPFGGFANTDISQANFGFNSILLIVFTIITFTVCLVFDRKQLQLFKSELRENTKADVQMHYRQLELNKRKKEVNRLNKKFAKSNKIKVF